MDAKVIGTYVVSRGGSYTLTVPQDPVGQEKLAAALGAMETAETSEMGLHYLTVALSVLASRPVEEIVTMIPLPTITRMVTDFREWTDSLHRGHVNINVEKTARAEKICPFDRNTTEWMRKFFPPGFPFREEAVAVGVKTIEAVALDMDLAGRYFALEDKIIINTDLDWKEMAGRLNCNFPDLGIRTEEDARAFMFLHEVGHGAHRDDILKNKDLDGRQIKIGDLLKARKNLLHQGKNLTSIEGRIKAQRLTDRQKEKAADAYAVERFRNWKQETQMRGYR